MAVSVLSEVSYTCGVTCDDMTFPKEIEKLLFIKDHDCVDRIEKLYYAARPADPICIYCCKEMDVADFGDYYPQCEMCEDT